MSRRRTYSDSFSGESDREIKELLSGKECEQKSRLKKVLLNVIKNELTARQTEIIMLYYFKEMDIVSIAEKLGISFQSVSKTMQRARLKIFRYMKYYIR